MIRTLWFAPLLLLLASPCVADIYGYVDEDGVAHLSQVQVDSRYYLFKKEAPPVEQPAISSAAEPLADAALLASLPGGKRYVDLIVKVAQEYSMDAALIHAVVAVESAFDPSARSPKGASGLMQLMPGTAERYGVTDVWNPLENLRGGTRYLRDLLALFKDDVSLALAAYNAGEGAVIDAGRKIPPYAETRSYVPKVLQLWERHRRRM